MAVLLTCCLLPLLAALLQPLAPVRAEGEALQRQKREWITAPRRLQENHDYTGLEFIARIRSDKENFTKIFYYLTGPGVDQPPVGVFGVDKNTGYVKIYSVLDREKISIYNLKGVARFTNGSYAERDIDLKITVVDENDCAPVITAQQVGQVKESSAAGTVVMKVMATDDDQENTDHSKIFYSIVEDSSTAGMFFINSQTGEIMVKQTTLDRETKDTYKLKIQASDLAGAAGGLSGTEEVTIKLLDINDNIPTLEKEFYEGSVQENTVNTEVMRIKAIDMDQIHTDNWLAVYKIVSGNEGGYFTITTDSKTNEGVIMINKSLDYEQIKALNLEVEVANKAEYNFGSGSVSGGGLGKPYPVKINVVNQKEGPRFQPGVKVVSLSEDSTTTTVGKVITTYAATDSDTLQTATNVRYAKLRDDDNWLIIDEKTAEIKLNKMPDRESKFLKNGTYYAEIIAISTDVPSKTATGTIAIQVEDYNDDCPKLITHTQTMCLEDHVIFATAVDEDAIPNSTPFEFSVIEGSSTGKWTVEHYNETTAILRDQDNLWPGSYKLALEIKDQQGKSCDEVEIIDVVVCTCEKNTQTCAPRRTSTSSLGPAGILLLLLGLLLLLLLPLLLLFCLCGGTAALADFKPIPFDTKQQLIAYHTEGQGEDKEIPLLHVPGEVDGSGMTARDINRVEGKGYYEELGGAAGRGTAFGNVNTSSLTAENIYNRYDYSSGQNEMEFIGGGTMTGQELGYSQYGGGVFDGMALSNQFLGEYYSSKLHHALQQSQQKDNLLVFDYEGQESLAGSVGCCSLLENDDDLAFLDDLGPKFKTLAGICHGSTFVTESVDAQVSIPPMRPVSPARPSTSTHTHVHTHRETIRDRDHVNVNTLNTSNVASASSTVLQEERITGRVHGSATIPKVQVQDKMVVPNQTLLVQQPAMYYAATPMYVVESNPQMMLVTGGAQQAVGQVGQVGLSQGLVQVGGLQASQGVVLVDGQVGMGGVTGQVVQDLSQGTLSGSRQLLVVGNGSSAGKQGVHLAQGFVQTGQGSTEQVRGQGVSGVVLVDRQVGMGGVTGQVVQDLSQGTLPGSRQVLVMSNGSSAEAPGVQLTAQSFSLGSRGSAGSNEDFAVATASKLKGSQRVVMQHKKVSVTERNIESSTQA